MSGMKFRRTCTVCNSTFFSPDRKAIYCIKCVKKRVVKHVPVESKPRVQSARIAQRGPQPAAVAPQRRPRAPRAPKAELLTPDLRRKITELYEEEFATAQVPIREVHSTIANRLWIKRQLVADVIRDILQARTSLSDQQKLRAIEMYQRFVETGHRPEGGRRRAISVALGLPYKQIMKLIREWSMSEYEKSPTPNPSRQQLFEIEKRYWEELNEQRRPLTDLPGAIADELGYVTRWQVLRWLDVLHDDERAFANVPDPPEDITRQIVAAYMEYLSSASPPDQGLHYSIAGRIAKVSPRQVHKVLQNYRHRMRAEYPLV
jgi:hypothetical protein